MLLEAFQGRQSPQQGLLGGRIFGGPRWRRRRVRQQRWCSKALGLGVVELLLLLLVMCKLEQCQGGEDIASMVGVLGVALLLLPVL
jgi:hypothetical protein